MKKLEQKDEDVSLKIVDSNSIIIKIPRSDLNTKKLVDSLVVSSKVIIEKTPNLIIDIRNNLGGTWEVYKSLFPYLYTNPILTGEGLYRCSKDLIEYQKNNIEIYKKDSTLLKFLPDAQVLLDSMLKYENSFFYSKPDTFKFDSIIPYPQNVVILFNYRCASATEMFLKLCKQSRKVIMAGEKTWGALDNVEAVPFTTPSGKYRLMIPRVKNFYGKNPPLDFVGITPDIRIPVEEKYWVKYVLNYLNKK
ncbi:MAG: hypothetical protein IPJ81_11245 [Chitinophagaceae bacterium]|nr:hypothetical protein [Chitinophagaceae bacterium]